MTQEILPEIPPYQQNRLSLRRMYTLLVLLGLVLGMFVARLFSLQVLQNEVWEARAQENRIEELNLRAPRGVIYDRNGVVLARNFPSYNVVITPAYLPEDPGLVDRMFQELAVLLDMPVDFGEISPANPYVPCVSKHGIRQIVFYGETTAPYRPVKIKCNVSRTVAMQVEERKARWPGVDVEIEPVRDYPTGESTAVVVGFLGPVPEALADYYEARGLDINRDKVGYAGVELYYQDLLAGRNGRRVVEVDVAGRILRDLEPPQNPIPGTNIRLTIDWRLQDAMYTIVREELEAWNAYFGQERFRNAAAIAMNPKTGEILGMVSIPTYNNQVVARYIPEDYYEYLTTEEFKPLLNHAISAEHPPGSVFKIVTATAALNEGIVRPNQVIETPGTIVLEQKFFAGDIGRQQTFYDWNWEKGGFGELKFLDCIAWSSNVCFYKVGGGYFDEIPEGVGICRLGTYARALGFGARTGIDLPGEAEGLVPDPKWKRIFKGENWSTGDTYLASVGQGYVLTTPLQLLVAASTIANGGKVVKPTILYQMLDEEGRVIQPFRPTILRDVTQDPVVEEYENPGGIGSCKPTGVTKTIAPETLALVREGMRRAVLYGTLKKPFRNFPISAAGKTGSAEYCDNRAQAQNRCIQGQWPSHAWTVAFAPYEDPEIAVVAFVYDGTEGAEVAAPIVRRILEFYFELKAQVGQ